MVLIAVVSILLVRFLSPAEYGKWSLVWQLIGTIAPLLSLGFLSTLAKFMPEYETTAEKSRLFSQTIFLVLIIFTVSSMIYLILISWLPRLFPLEVKTVKYSFMFFIGIIAFFNLAEGYYRGLGKFNQWTVIDGMRSFMSSGVAVLACLYLAVKFEVVFYSYFLVSLAVVFIMIYYFRNSIVLPDTLKLEKKILTFSLSMIAGQIIFLIGNTMDSVLLRVLLKDTSQVGFYNAGIRIPKMFETMLIGPLSVPFLYYFTNPENLENRKKIFEFGSRMLGITCGVLALFLFSFAKEIVVVLFSSVYEQSIIVLRIFSLILFFQGFNILFSPFFTAINKPLLPVFASVITTATLILFNFLLIPVFKAAGPTISTLIGLLFQTIFLVYLLKRNNIECVFVFIKLLLCVSVSIIIGIYISYYLTLPCFLAFVLLTKSFVIADIKILTKIVFNKGVNKQHETFTRKTV
jgi:O-antigen/teichoic acid export membrane protein